jgi:hypothetical protein
MADVIECILKGACAGQAIYNVLHFRDNGDLGPAALAAAMEAGAGASWINELVDGLCNDYFIGSILTRSNKDTTPGPQIETAFASGYEGQVADTAGALPVSAVIKWLTAVGGRSGRGRSYIGVLPQSRVVDGLLHVDEIAAIQGFLDATLAIFTSGGGSYNGNFELGVWSPTLSAFNEVVAGVLRTAAKTQRRRQLGVGI